MRGISRMPDKVVLNDNESQEWQSSRLLLFLFWNVLPKWGSKSWEPEKKQTENDLRKFRSACRLPLGFPLIWEILRSQKLGNSGKFLCRKKARLVCVYKIDVPSSGLSKANWCLEIIWLDSSECKHHFCEAIGKIRTLFEKENRNDLRKLSPKNYFKNVPSFFVRCFLRSSSKSTSKTLRKTKHV